MIPKIKGKFPRVPHAGIIGKDSDHDGVFNGIDCYPKDRSRQGVIHNIKEKMQQKYENWKQEQREKRVMENEARRQEKVAYYQEREKQRVMLGKEKAKLEARAQINRLKQSYSPKKPVKYSSFDGGSLFSNVLSNSKAKPKSEFDRFLMRK